MKDLIVTPTIENYQIPRVHCSAKDGICKIEGESYMEHASRFYREILNWIDEYFAAFDQRLEFNFRLRYFNTASTLGLTKILFKLQRAREEGKDITVRWYFQEPDEDMVEAEGQDLAEEVGIEMEFLPYKQPA
jgi:hypothetical protein